MRFIVDVNVGRLATWLRALGYDTLFINPIDDSELVRIAREEERVLLTRDTRIFERSVISSGLVSAFFVEGSAWKEQIRQVGAAFHLTMDKAFTRCVVCNTLVEPVSAEHAVGKVPEDVLNDGMSVVTCPSCGRFYWKGGHWERMRATLAELLCET